MFLFYRKVRSDENEEATTEKEGTAGSQKSPVSIEKRFKIVRHRSKEKIESKNKKTLDISISNLDGKVVWTVVEGGRTMNITGDANTTAIDDIADTSLHLSPVSKAALNVYGEDNNDENCDDHDDNDDDDDDGDDNDDDDGGDGSITNTTTVGRTCEEPYELPSFPDVFNNAKDRLKVFHNSVGFTYEELRNVFNLDPDNYEYLLMGAERDFSELRLTSIVSPVSYLQHQLSLFSLFTLISLF